ncbi:hypothetical protein AB0N05_28000 [Nocardia sp. NPDC051030]|uniref:hypothetical protein n=1 Tax=Nocardia sp. NPDC051030 TaxID=3155162 RepID=UPI00342AC80F
MPELETHAVTIGRHVREWLRGRGGEFRSQRRVLMLSHALVDPGLAYWPSTEDPFDV